MDIPAVSMPIARSLKTYDICGIVLCDKNLKTHLFRRHLTSSSFSQKYITIVR